MEFIGDDSSSDEEENGEEQQQPPPQKSSSSKPIIIQQQKQPPLPHIKVKKDDVNMKMKLRLLKQYEKRFGKIENSSNTVNISSVKQEQQSVSLHACVDVSLPQIFFGFPSAHFTNGVEMVINGHQRCCRARARGCSRRPRRPR